MLISVKLLSNLCIRLGKWKVRRLSQRLFTIYMGNRSVYGLGKWYAKFRTGKFSSGIAFTICTDQFHLTENGREGLKLVSKMAEEMEHEFPLGIFHPEKQDYLFRCSVAPGNFPLGRPKKSCSIYFRTGFPGKFLSKGQIPGRARLKERLSRSKLKQAFLIDSDTELVIRLMKSSASEPGLRIHLVMATTSS